MRKTHQKIEKIKIPNEAATKPNSRLTRTGISL
jgi:hypothetical protein